MKNDHLMAVAVLMVSIITVLLVAFILVGPTTSGGSDWTPYDFRANPTSMGEHEVRTIVKELFVKNTSGSETFVVDESWTAYGIYVEGITSSDVTYRVIPPGTEEDFSQTNHVDETIKVGGGAGIDGRPGNWTLKYDVAGGLVKISIVKIVTPDPGT